MYSAQQCFVLSDEGIEGAIDNSQAVHGFIGIEMNRETAPDATTLLKLRRLLESNKLIERIFTAVDSLFGEQRIAVQGRRGLVGYDQRSAVLD